MTNAMTTVFGTVLYPEKIAFAYCRITRNDTALEMLSSRLIGNAALDKKVVHQAELLKTSNEHYRKVVDEWVDQVMKDERIFLDTGETEHLRKYFDWIELPDWFVEKEVVK